jgi:hypothetical protein
MRRYRRCWTYGWGSVSLVLVGLACVTWGPATTLGVWAGVAGTTFALTLGCYRAADDPVTFPEATRFGLYAGCLLGTAAVAVFALGTVNGAWASALVFLGAATSPWCVTWAVRFARIVGGTKVDDRPARAPRSGAPVLPPSPGPSFPESAGSLGSTGPRQAWLTDAELCQAWRASFAALLAATGPADRARVVSLRQDYLDELLRRHPEPVRAWLETGPRAAGGPEQHLRASRRRDCDAA